MLEHIVTIILEILIPACELMGITVVAVSALSAFWRYVHRLEDLGGHLEFQTQRKATGQTELDVHHVLGDQTAHVAPESAQRRHRHHRDTHQFAGGDQNF